MAWCGRREQLYKWPRCSPEESPPCDRPGTKGSLLEEGNQGEEQGPGKGYGQRKGTEDRRERREEERKSPAGSTWGRER